MKEWYSKQGKEKQEREETWLAEIVYIFDDNFDKYTNLIDQCVWKTARFCLDRPDDDFEAVGSQVKTVGVAALVRGLDQGEEE